MDDFVGVWRNVGFSWDGNLNTTPSLYIDGVSQGSADFAGSVPAGPTGSISTISTITIGDRNLDNALFEKIGSIQAIGVWNKPLTSANHVSLYNEGKVLYNPIESGDIIDFWFLDGAVGYRDAGTTIPAGKTILASEFGTNNLQTRAGENQVVQGAEYSIGPRDSNRNVITIPRTDLTGSERIINTRFSAPGGPEIQTIGYLDAHSSTYSAYNALPFRNLSVLGSGSGEAGTIRVEDDQGRRRGLKSLRALHQGKFGIDSQFGSISATVYPTNGSFNKQHRNTQTRYESGSALIITGSAHDNMHINSPIPRSEFQYSWINSAISGSNWRNGQRILGYAPRDGIVSSSAGYVEAIVFPSASTIYSV